MSKYKCERCYSIFYEPHCETYTETFYSHGPKTVEYCEESCPRCGYDDFEEYYEDDEDYE